MGNQDLLVRSSFMLTYVLFVTSIFATSFVETNDCAAMTTMSTCYADNSCVWDGAKCITDNCVGKNQQMCKTNGPCVGYTTKPLSEEPSEFVCASPFRRLQECAFAQDLWSCYHTDTCAWKDGSCQYMDCSTKVVQADCTGGCEWKSFAGQWSNTSYCFDKTFTLPSDITCASNLKAENCVGKCVWTGTTPACKNNLCKGQTKDTCLAVQSDTCLWTGTSCAHPDEAHGGRTCSSLKRAACEGAAGCYWSTAGSCKADLCMHKKEGSAAGQCAAQDSGCTWIAPSSSCHATDTADPLTKLCTTYATADCPEWCTKTSTACSNLDCDSKTDPSACEGLAGCVGYVVGGSATCRVAKHPAVNPPCSGFTTEFMCGGNNMFCMWKDSTCAPRLCPAKLTETTCNAAALGSGCEWMEVHAPGNKVAGMCVDKAQTTAAFAPRASVLAILATVIISAIPFLSL